MIDVEMLRPTADEMLSGLSAEGILKQRILFRGTALDSLGEVAGEMLSGLQATPALRHRILVKTERMERTSRPAVLRPARWPKLSRLTPVAGMALVLTFMIGLGMNYGSGRTGQLPIGSPAPQSDLGYTGYMGATGETGSVPQYRSLFVGEGANPPLIGVNGRFYQMLTVSVPQNALGTPIAEVQEFTDEPSLAATVGVISNVVQPGAQVYSVDGMSNKTACVAEVDGTYRLFQRVGYASSTFIGSEQFEDTFDVFGNVSAIELSGVGVITDEQKANDLIYTLNEFAVYNGSDSILSDQALTVYLTNGLSLQLQVQGDTLGGCGSWVCPEFFDAFQTSMA